MTTPPQQPPFLSPSQQVVDVQQFAMLVAEVRVIVTKQSEITRQMGDLGNKLEQTYVPKGTYEAHREADDHRFHRLEKDNDDQASFRRQVAASMIVGFLLLLIPLIGTVNSVLK